MWGTDNLLIAAGDTVTISCGVLVYDHSTELSWYFNGDPVETNDSKSNKSN